MQVEPFLFTRLPNIHYVDDLVKNALATKESNIYRHIRIIADIWTIERCRLTNVRSHAECRTIERHLWDIMIWIVEYNYAGNTRQCKLYCCRTCCNQTRSFWCGQNINFCDWLLQKIFKVERTFVIFKDNTELWYILNLIASLNVYV